jgi:tetratricopeptide (TPR) repeat protein
LGNGTHPAGYHLLNLLLQAIDVALVYLVGLAIFEEIAPAFATAVIWSVHPLLTESVTNIVGRSDQLAAFGVLAGLLLHIRAGSAAGGRKLRCLAALGLVVGIGMFSKESAIVVLAAMALYDLAYPAAEGWRARRWGYAAAAVPIALYFYARAQVFARVNPGVMPAVDNPLVGADFWVARLTAVKVIGKYLWLFLWPARLSADYSYNQIPVTVDWQGVLSLAVCGAAAVAAIGCLRQSPRTPFRALFFCIAFFFAALAPTSNVFLVIGAIMAERFLYLPLIGLAGCLAMAIFAAGRRLAPGKSQAAAAVAVAAVALAFAARTFARNFDWLNEHTLWAASEISAPNSFKVHMSVAREQLDAKQPDLDRAIAEAGRAVQIVADLPDDRSSARPYATAGEADRRKGDSLPDGPERQAWFRKALEVLLRGQRVDLAVKQADTRANRARGLTAITEGWEPLYLELGHIYQRLGEWDKAVEALGYGRSIKLHPQFFDEMSRVYRLAGDNHQAEITLMEALVADPSVTVFASQLVDLYTQSEPQSCAVRRAGGATSLDLNCPLVHDQLCTAARNMAILYAQSGKRDRGATARTAIGQMGCPASLFQ